MRSMGFLLLCALVLPTVGTVSRVPPSGSCLGDEPAGLKALRQAGAMLYRAGRFGEALQVFEKGSQQAARLSLGRAWVRFRSNQGGCYFALRRFRAAMFHFLEARGLAERLGDWESVAALSHNIASVYAQMNQIGAARQAAEEGLRVLPSGSRYRARLLLRAGSLAAKAGDQRASERLLGRAIAEARRNRDAAVEANGWHHLGAARLERADWDGAAVAVGKELALRTRLGRDLHFAYYNRGRLNLARGSLPQAARDLEAALRSAGPSGEAAVLYPVLFQLGRARALQGDLRAALRDFEKALPLARRLGTERLPPERAQISLESELSKLFAAVAETSAQLYFASGRREYAERGFQALEEGRAASLFARQREARTWWRNLPAEYWTVLERLKGLEARELEDSAIRGETERLKNRLIEMETHAGLEGTTGCPPVPPADHLLQSVRAALRPEQAWISFHLAEPASFRWEVWRSGLRLARLPSGAVLRERIGEFRVIVEKSSPGLEESGAKLYSALLGGLGGAEKRGEWLLSLEGPLFELPFAALRNGQGRFLAEQRSLRLVPGARTAAAPGAAGGWGSYLGVGDAIYNSADPRWPGFRVPATAEQLPRAAGSAREIRRCAAALGVRGPDFLEGAGVRTGALRRALEQPHAVCHLAAHLRPPGKRREEPLLALSLGTNGESEYLSAGEIGLWSGLPVKLVVLSACSSGYSTVLPGAGLLGMTRAWLTAGAGSVVASLWATPDDSGELFVRFYENLRTWRRPATALHQAQLAMLRSGTWRAEPRYWAAYFVIGRE